MHPTWTDDDAAAAEKEGWAIADIWDAFHSKAYYIVWPPSAKHMVVNKARSRSALHIKALSIVMGDIGPKTQKGRK